MPEAFDAFSHGLELFEATVVVHIEQIDAIFIAKLDHTVPEPRFLPQFPIHVGPETEQ
jgi:hypothetical protein